VFIPYSEFP